ncbi:MAG: EthD family reductase [Nitriliruptoraceae bacterium]|nr:EthD family reductase [Nitriliruptoraceae bacterium]
MSGPVKLIALLKAKPGLSRAEFEKRWVDDHAPLALKFPRLAGYRINIAIEEYQEIEGELPYDGTAEMWWDSLEDMQADFNSDEAAVAVDDADTFTITRTHLVTREHVLREQSSTR